MIILKYNPYHIILSSEPLHSSLPNSESMPKPSCQPLRWPCVLLPGPHSLCKTTLACLWFCKHPGYSSNSRLPSLKPPPRILFSRYCHTSFLESSLKHHYLRKPSLTIGLKLATHPIGRHILSLSLSHFFPNMSPY